MRDNVYRAIVRQTDGIGELFCTDLLAQTSISGVLRGIITIPIYITSTDRRHTEDATTYKSKGTKTVVITTSYSSQMRTAATGVTRPFPSYIQQYPPSRVTSACSCLVTGTNIPTYVPIRYCENEVDTTSYTTLTYTVSASGRKTVTSTYTDTTTRYKGTTGPFPTACPAANGVPYIASDRTSWDRLCSSYLAGYRPLPDFPDEGVKAPNFDACIEKCVDYNTRKGYKQCQVVQYITDTKNCFLANSPQYIAGGQGGAQAASLIFYEPSTTISDYCASLSPTP